MIISTSKFVAGVQCLKPQYWQVHEPELAAQPDAAAEAIIEQGREGGCCLLASCCPVAWRSAGWRDRQAIRTTQELIANPEVPGIFEGAFENDGVFALVDILHRRRDKRWLLFEVTSTAGLKEEHLDDVAIRSRVVSRSGLDLASSCLTHVNRTTEPMFFRAAALTRVGSSGLETWPAKSRSCSPS